MKKILCLLALIGIYLFDSSSAFSQCAAFSGLAGNQCSNAAISTLVPNTPGAVFSGTGIVGNTFNPALAGPGTWIITCTVGPPCNNFTTQTVSVIPMPTAVNAGPDVSICAGQSTVLAGSGNGANFLWSPTAGLSNPAIANPTATPAGTTTYTLTTSNFGGGGGGPVVDQQSLTDNAYMAGFSQVDLAQSFIPTQTNICGASVYLKAGIGSGTGNITIQLYNLLPNAGGVIMASGTAMNVPVGGIANVSWASVAVTPGTTYYMRYTSSNSSLGLAGSVTNSYPNGQVYANAGYGSWPTYDYTFQTFSCPGISCGISDQVTITINPLPVATFTGLNTAYCNNSPLITLVPTVPGGTFSGPGVSGNTFNASLAAIGPNTITYTITVAGCTNSSSQVITINASPTVNAGPDLLICAGGSVPLQGSSNVANNLWTPPGGLSNPSILTPNANPGITTTYYLTGTSPGGGGGPVVDQSSLTFNAYMTAFSQTCLAQSFRPSQSTMCGASVYLQNVGSGTGNITIKLYNLLPNAGGIILAQGTANNVPPGGVATVSWPSVNVTPGTTYYMDYTSSNMTLGLTGSVSNPYPNGFVYSNPGYGPFPTYDFTFETFYCPGPACVDIDTMVVTVDPCALNNSNIDLLASTCGNGNICIQGEVTGEFNPDEYILERRTGNGNFELVNQLPSESKDYIFIDQPGLDGTFNYRLTSVDANSVFLVSGEVQVNLLSPSDAMIIYPNPSNGTFSISLIGDQLMDSMMDITVYDATGSLVYQSEAMGPLVTLKETLTAGYYLVKCTSGAKVFTGRIVVN